VLRPGGHFCVSDVVTSAPPADPIRKAAALYVGCVAKAETRYLDIVRSAGLRDIGIAKFRRIDLPDATLADALAAGDIAAARDADLHVKSVTVVGVKPVS
jgi:hypothetical protein